MGFRVHIAYQYLESSHIPCFFSISQNTKPHLSNKKWGLDSGHTPSVMVERLFFGLLFVFFQNVLNGLF